MFKELKLRNNIMKEGSVLNLLQPKVNIHLLFLHRWSRNLINFHLNMQNKDKQT